MNKRKFDRQSRVPEFLILCLSIVIVVSIGALSFVSAASAEAAAAEQKRSQTVTNLDRELLSRLTDAETGQRGYLVTGQDQFLQPYKEAVPVIPGLLRRLNEAAQSTPGIEPLVSAKLSELQQTIDLYRANQNAQAVAIVNNGSGKALMDEIRARLAALDSAEQARLAASAAIADRNSARLRIVGTVGSGLMFGFLVISAITIFRGLNRRDELYRIAFEAEKKLATTLASIADGVISTDPAAKVVYLNPIAEQLTGWTQHDSAGRHISEVFRIVNETTRDAVANPLVRAIEQGEVVGLANHTKLIARDSREFFIDDSAAPIRDERNQIVGAVLVFRDISERRFAEQRLARSNEELQQFAFAASHDLRSPLRSISTMAQLLARQFGESLGPDGKEKVEFITDASVRMTRLVDDLLNLAKATDEDQGPVGVASLQDAFVAARNNLRADAEAAGATITATPLPEVAAREVHVELVMQNLLSNGLKYRGPEAPVIEVSAARQNGDWIVSVKDNGIGIDPQYADHIFQPFKRLHGKEYDGTGLGLWTCKKIVAGYGGRIWMESEPGRGATFFFSLPGLP